MSLVEAADRVVSRLEQSQWIPQLLVRLYVGYFFFETGWAKAQKTHFADGGVFDQIYSR